MLGLGSLYNWQIVSFVFFIIIKILKYFYKVSYTEGIMFDDKYSQEDIVRFEQYYDTACNSLLKMERQIKDLYKNAKNLSKREILKLKREYAKEAQSGMIQYDGVPLDVGKKIESKEYKDLENKCYEILLKV